ncbi:MAG: outer membrane lipoprotein-sorting protein [Sulfurovum sp.]|nr:outer membrane lipoprotein-sorting protein [Sulfurovum sp.]
MQLQKTLLLVTIALSILSPSLQADDAKARAIMKKVDARDDGKTLEQDMQMILVDKSGRTRSRAIKSLTKDFGKDSRQVMFFKTPADVKNTAFLTYSYDASNKDDDQWLYLPALRKVKRIPSSDKSSSFMGSDFSYSDMGKVSLDDYDFKLLKDSKVRGHAVWTIQSTPRSKAIAKKSGYTKSIELVRKDNYVIVRSVGFVRGGKKKYLDVSKLHKQKGIWVVDETSMTTKKGKKKLHKTILRFSKTKLNKPISDKMFSTLRLEKGL